MHLPKAATRDSEGAAGSSLDQALVTLDFFVYRILHLSGVRRCNLNLFHARPILEVQTQFTDVFDSQWHIAGLHNLMAALAIRAGVAQLIHVQLHARAVTQSAGTLVTRGWLNSGSHFDSGHSAQSFLQNICFEFALVVEGDVAKLRPSGTAFAGCLPEVFHPVRASH